MSAVEINGTDPSTYGLTVQSAPDFASSPGFTWDEQQLADRPGASVSLVRTPARTLRLTGYLRSTSLASLASNLDKLKDLVHRKTPNELIFQLSTSRKLQARLRSFRAEPRASAFGSPFDYGVEMEWSAPDPPLWLAVAETTITAIGAGTSGGQLLAGLGTAPLFPRVRVYGPVSSEVTLTLRNSTMGTTGSMTFEVALAGTSAYLVVDMEKETAHTNETGVFSSGMNAVASWSTGNWFALTPDMYTFSASSWPHLSVSTGGADAVYTARYY